MNKKFTIWFISIAILIIALIIFFSMYSYKMSPKILSITENSVKNGLLTLKITNNNEKGYYKTIKIVKKSNTVIVYVMGTGFKMFRNKDDKNIHEINIDIDDIEKVIIKGQSEELLVYEFKGI